jgi:hypothetical protein
MMAGNRVRDKLRHKPIATGMCKSYDLPCARCGMIDSGFAPVQPGLEIF